MGRGRRGPEPAAAIVGRPVYRRDCVGGFRPCPFVGCRHHLYLNVNEDTGSIRLAFPDLEVWELKETCSLDAADKAEGVGASLDVVGRKMNLTRERVRQLEVRGLIKLKILAPEEDS